jgi:hypothetical protein
MHKLIASLLVAAFISPALAAETEGDYLYKVTTARAASGSLSDLLDWIQTLKESDHFAASGEPAPLVMRHSQGDQWDLLIITPMNSWETYYATAAIKRRENAVQEYSGLLADGAALIAFAEDHFAYGPPFSIIQSAFDENNFFHIEMFNAAPAKSAELLAQRQMENAYLAATGQTTNMIFYRAAGSDVDIFTIGFHTSLEAFATPANVTDDEKDEAAKAAGFKELADISFYLRSLISAHHDTLAVKVN